MSVNEAYPILDNQSECAGCHRWLDDQVLRQINTRSWCVECVGLLCGNCGDEAPFEGGKPKYPRSYSSPFGLCGWCAVESISL